MFKNLVKGLFVLSTLFMLNCPAQAFYTDMDQNHWAYQSIKFLTEVGVVVGYPDGTYKPDIPVTRAEFASMAIKALGQEDANVTQDIHFTDVKPDFWAYNIIKKAVYIAIGINMDGIKEVLGMWVGENESAKFWLSVMNSLKNRGVEDILIACVDILTGFANVI